MRPSRAILIAAIALVVGFLGGLASGSGSLNSTKATERYQALQAAMQDKNTQFLKMVDENNNLLGQIRLLEEMVGTLNEQIEEINAVIERPGEKSSPSP